MRKIFTAVALVCALILGNAVPAQAGQGAGDLVVAQSAMHLPLNYCDGMLNWDGWTWPSDGSNWGAHNLCGLPNHGHFKVGAWDGSSDGHCVEIWRAEQLTNSVWYAVPGTRACGADVVKISAWRYEITRRLMIVKSTTAGTWVLTKQFYYQF